MTRFTHLTSPLSPADHRYAQMLAQRETAATRHAYLEVIARCHVGRTLIGTNYRFTFNGPTGESLGLPPVVVDYDDIEIDNRRRADEFPAEPARKIYIKEFENSWKLRERGILHAFEDMENLMVILQHRYGSFDVRGWKTQFSKVCAARAAQGTITCLVRECQYCACPRSDLELHSSTIQRRDVSTLLANSSTIQLLPKQSERRLSESVLKRSPSPPKSKYSSSSGNFS